MRLCEYDYMEETHLIMGTTSQYCLRWNNHQTNLLSAFDSLLRQEAFTDVTLACEDGVTLQAHRLVLASCSSYFSNLFSITSPSQHPIVILKDVRASEMRALLHYMYRGEVNVEQSQLKELLKVAEGLRVKGLAEDLVSNTQTHPLPLITSNSQPLPLLVTPQRYTPGVSPSPTPVDSRSTPNNCNEGWEPESFYANNIRHAFHSPPSSPFKRTKSDIKEEPIHIREHSPLNRHTNPYFQPYLSHHLNMNHSPRLPISSFDSKDHKSLKESYDLNNERVPSRSPTCEMRDRKSPVPISQSSTPFSVSGRESPSLKRPRQFAEPPLISPTPILRTALAHARPFQTDVTSLVSLANSMIPLPPLLSARTQSIATNEELRRASDSHRDPFEQKFISQASKKSDSLSDEESKTFIDIARDEEVQEKINNGPVLSDFPSYHLDPNNHSHFSNFVSYVPTPKPEWKRYKQYTKADLMQAIDAVRKGMTALQASRKYKVPSRTLYDKIKKMGINTIPRRLPSKRNTALDIEASDLSALHLRHGSGYIDGRSSRGEYFTDRASSEELNDHPSVQNLHIQASLTSKEDKPVKSEISEDCRTSEEDSAMETSTRGSFSLVGTKVFSGDDSGPLDLTDTEGHIPTRPTIQERA